MRLTIRQRLFLLTAAALTPALVAFGVIEVQLRQERTADIHVTALRQARLASSEVRRIVDGLAALLRATAAARELGILESPQCGAFLKIVRMQDQQVEAVAIVDPVTGTIWCDGPDVGDAGLGAFAKEVAAQDDVVIGRYFRANATSPALLPIGIPYRGTGGRQVVAIAQISLDWLDKELRARALAPGDALTIADRDGVILARHPLPERFVGTRIPSPFHELVVAPTAGTQEVQSQDGTHRVIGYVPATLTGGLYISAGVSTEQAFAAINRASATSAAVMVAGAILAFGFAWFVGQRVIQKPMDRLLSVSNAWQDGDLSVRAGIAPGRGEFETLAAALDAMMAGLQQRDAERHQASEQRALLARELSHRAKNTLALVQAIAAQTFVGTDPEIRQRFAERLVALAGSFDLLVAADWTGAGLLDTIEGAIRPHRTGEGVRFSMAGPDAALPAQAVVGLSLALHELATNAAKYGALTAPGGRVAIRWNLHDGPPPRIVLSWLESGGPSVNPPSRQGFGSKLMRRILPDTLHPLVETDYARDGVRVTIGFDLASEKPAA